MRVKLLPSQFWGAIVREWGLEFMAPSDLEGAMVTLSRARAGLADEISPTCLFPVGFGGKDWSLPVTCAADASRGSHSIQEAGSLEEIASPGPRGRYVLAVFPDINHLIPLTKGVAGRPATKWLWDIDAVPPRSVGVGEASVAHFACSLHDSNPRYLGAADNLEIPDLGGSRILDDREPPTGLGQFMDSLFVLAYRTLLFRFSQLRGVEKTAISALSEQSDADNRFGVQSCLGRLKELSSLLTAVSRAKSGYDRRILGDASALGLIHHVVEFFPSVRYAFSEFIPFGYGRGSRRKSIWSAVNVLLINGRTWLVLSHPHTGNSDVRGISQEVRSWTTTNPTSRKRLDLNAFANLTNVYVSPVDFEALPSSDRSALASTIAWKICEEPFEEGIKLLRSAPRGRDLVERLERELGGYLVSAPPVGPFQVARRF